MELQEVLLKRRSIRCFTDETISAQDIDCLMHAAMSGPSACNKQPWEFYVVTDEKMLKQLKTASRYTDYDSRLAIIVCGNLEYALPEGLADYWIQDCSAATQNILLCAVDLGLGAVWCGIYPQTDRVENLQKMLGLKASQLPLNVIFVGHPAQERTPKDWYLEERVHYI